MEVLALLVEEAKVVDQRRWERACDFGSRRRLAGRTFSARLWLINECKPAMAGKDPSGNFNIALLQQALKAKCGDFTRVIRGHRYALRPHGYPKRSVQSDNLAVRQHLDA
jgi:hypothetical protein